MIATIRQPRKRWFIAPPTGSAIAVVGIALLASIVLLVQITTIRVARSVGSVQVFSDADGLMVFVERKFLQNSPIVADPPTKTLAHELAVFRISDNECRRLGKIQQTDHYLMMRASVVARVDDELYLVQRFPVVRFFRWNGSEFQGTPTKPPPKSRNSLLKASGNGQILKLRSRR